MKLAVLIISVCSALIGGWIIVHMSIFVYVHTSWTQAGSGIVIIPQRQLRKIPYLKALTSSRWSPVWKTYTLIQAKEWNNDLTHLSDLLRFLREDKDLPQDWKRTFSLIRLADMLCVDTFIQTVARETRIPVPLLDNSNPIKSVRMCLWAAYRLARYLNPLTPIVHFWLHHCITPIVHFW